MLRFLAWTPGVERAALPRLEGIGFDHVCSSLAWWDGRANWLVEEIEVLRRIAPVIASPEPSFFERRAAACRRAATFPHPIVSRCGWPPPPRMACSCRWASSTPRVVPFDAALGGPEDLQRARDEAPCDLTADIAAANALVDRVAAYQVDGEMRQLTDAAWLRHGAAAIRCAGRAQRVTRRAGAGQSRCRPQRRRSVCRFRRCRRRRARRSHWRSRCEGADAPMGPVRCACSAYASRRDR